jgi:hypothetical protein
LTERRRKFETEKCKVSLLINIVDREPRSHRRLTNAFSGAASL